MEKEKEIYSEFEIEYMGFSGSWMKERIYYKGDMTEYSKTEDFKKDWRFCEVKNKRNQLVFIGLKDDIH